MDSSTPASWDTRGPPTDPLVTVLILAHAATAGGVELELILLGAGFLAAAWFFRPSQASNGRSALVCLLIGIALIAAAFALPRVTEEPRPPDHHDEKSSS